MESDQVGPVSDKTRENIRQAQAYEFWWGDWHIEWKPWVGWVEIPYPMREAIEKHGWDELKLYYPVKRQWFFVKPRTFTISTEFWNEGPIKWWRCYWLTLGISSCRRLPERRADWRRTRGTQYGRRRFDATERRTVVNINALGLWRRKGERDGVE